MKLYRMIGPLGFAAALLGSAPAHAQAGATLGQSVIAGDFDCDGYDDIATGAPGETINGDSGAGAVYVYYRVRPGTLGIYRDRWHQDVGGIGGSTQPNDSFGEALAAGDFNNDSCDDLVIGVPYEDIDGETNAGAVHVLYGSPDGLEVAGTQMWHQNTSGIRDASEAEDYFGWSLATGDFDDDGYDDLAVGVPGEDHTSATNAGLVHVFYGTGNGLGAARDATWHQASTQTEPTSSGSVTYHMQDTPERDDYFGMSLAAGDLNEDGYEDLVVGIPYEDVGSLTNAGAIHMILGGPSGFVARGNEFWHQNRSGIPGASEANDQFGYAVAIGDFDGYEPDIAVGVPGEAIGSITGAGAVNVLYNPAGTYFAADIWHQDSSGVIGTSEAYDYFGRSLAVGDFDHDAYDDLAIGAPYEAIGSDTYAGGINILRGAYGGLTASGDVTLHQDKLGGVTAEPFDYFATSLAVANTDSDDFPELIVGVPGDTYNGMEDVGLVHVLRGTSSSGVTFDEGSPMLYLEGGAIHLGYP